MPQKIHRDGLQAKIKFSSVLMFSEHSIIYKHCFYNHKKNTKAIFILKLHSDPAYGCKVGFVSLLNCLRCIGFVSSNKPNVLVMLQQNKPGQNPISSTCKPGIFGKLLCWLYPFLGFKYPYLQLSLESASFSHVYSMLKPILIAF